MPTKKPKSKRQTSQTTKSRRLVVPARPPKLTRKLPAKPRARRARLSSRVNRRVRRRVRFTLFPSKLNQYRPRLIGRYGTAVLVAVALLGQVFVDRLGPGPVLGEQASDLNPTSLLALTNEQRLKYGDQPLQLSDKLNQAAALKAADMFASQYWAHESPTGTTPWHWFDTVGYSYTQAGENLARNFYTPEGTVTAWMNSPSHRANVLKSSYTDVGFAVRDGTLDGKPAVITVAMYAMPQTVASVAGATETLTGGDITSTSLSNHQPLTILARIQVGMQSLTPAAVMSLAILGLAALLAMVAHLYRRKLPAEIRHSWYRNHGIYKAIGFMTVMVVTIILYGSAGQI